MDKIKRLLRKNDVVVTGECMTNDVRFYVGKCKHLIAVWKGAHYHTGISLTELHLKNVEEDGGCRCYIVDANQKKFRSEVTEK